jgi:hypothetical protein
MKRQFTQAEKKLLFGIAGKIGAKRGCSGMYVRHLINGDRGANSALAKAIIKDLEIILAALSPHG